MDKNYLIQLTQNLYRLTLLFPKKEPLRYKMKELANDILAQSLRNEYTNKTENGSPRISADLEVLDGFFEVAKTQNWVKAQELLNLQEEYSKLKEGLEKFEIEKIEDKPQQTLSPDIKSGLNERQEKILTFLKENGQAQVWQVKQVLPEVTKRTLRRDFEHLLNQGAIERMGEKNNTFYQLRRAGELT